MSGAEGGTSTSFSPMECDDDAGSGGQTVGRSWLVGAAGRLASGLTAPGEGR